MPKRMNRCDECNKPFPADNAYRKKCLPCWKKEQGYDLSKADQALIDMQDFYVSQNVSIEVTTDQAIRNEIGHLSSKLSDALHLLNKERASNRKLVAQNNALRKGKSDMTNLDKLFVKDLLKLCHPDRHSGINEEIATEATKKLLGMRRK